VIYIAVNYHNYTRILNEWNSRCRQRARIMDSIASPELHTAIAIRSYGRSAGPLALMLAGVFAVYLPLPLPRANEMMVGSDFIELHLHRIRFAQDALFGAHPHIPGWYPRELMGTPFWSNVQNFPLLPTRLLLFFVCSPVQLYAAAVNLAAVLAALFTFLYCRRLALSPWAAALAGWTFACSGFFASRVMAGHLPLLEAYPALPMLLWLIERYHAPGASPMQSGRRLAAIGVGCGCVSLAGHPQLPVYAVIAAGLYCVYRLPRGRAVRALASIAAGIAMAAVVLWPMFLLIRRSTRLMALDLPANDIAFPYRRMLAFFLPWAQGWPRMVPRTPHMPVIFPDDSYFWDTVCYVGWIPCVAVAVLFLRALRQRRVPNAPWAFIAVLGAGALLLSFPAARAPFAGFTGTILRSPSRLLYLTTFALAMGFGVALDLLIARARSDRRWLILIIVVLDFHLIDLGVYARMFIARVALPREPTAAESRVLAQVGNQRIAHQIAFWTPLNRQIDDVGYFDSVALAGPYLGILDLVGKPTGRNVQYMDGSEFNQRALSACGVRFVVKAKYDAGANASNSPSVDILPVREPAERARIYSWSDVVITERKDIHRKLRDPTFDLNHYLLLAVEDGLLRNPVIVPSADAKSSVTYRRDSEDQITLAVMSRDGGVVRCLEACDSGWSASIDGKAAPLIRADDLFLATVVGGGEHCVQFKFVTPGRLAGRIISIAGLSVLTLVAGLEIRQKNRLTY
jgi:hypothetical protein